MTLRERSVTAGWLAVVALVASVVTVGAAERFGPAAVVALLGLVAGVLLVLQPAAPLILLVVWVSVVESDEQAFLAVLQKSGIYGTLPGVPLGMIDLLLGATVAGVALRAARDRELRLPDPMTLPLLLLVCACAIGTVQGAFARESDPVDYLNALRRLSYLVLIPFLVVNLVRTRRHVHVALVIAVAVVAYKSVTGMVGWLLGAGRALEGTVLTYYGPLANFLIVVFVLVVLAGAVSRARLPAPVLWLGPLALAVLLLSFRRNWWIGLVVGTVVVGLIVTGRRGRALLIPAGTVLAVAMAAGFSLIADSNSDSPVIRRAQSLNPAQLQGQSDDRYRIDEQRNVLLEIREHPVVGIGLGAPWTVREPLSEVFENGRNYTHVTVLWYWLKLGIVGLIAYVVLQASIVRAGLKVWREAASPRWRAFGLGAAGGVLALLAAETTGSFTGVEQRMTILLATIAGMLAAMISLTARQDPRAR